MLRYNVGEEKSATFRFCDHFDFARNLFLYFRPGEIAREVVPKRNIGRLGQLENLSGKHTLSNEGGFLTQSEFRRISSFHETRKHLLEQRRARSQLFVKTSLNETGERVVESVRKGEGSSGATLGLTAASSDMSEKFGRRFGLGRFSKSGSEEFSTVIVGTADENFFPRLGVSGSEILAIGELINFCRRQFAQQFGREIAEERIAQAIDAFKMFEEKDQPFQMCGGELAVDTVERVGNGMRNSIFRQVFLQLKNVATEDRDILVLRWRNPPNEHMNLTRVLRKISGNLFANKSVRFVRNRQTPVNAIVIGDGDKIHPALAQLRIKIDRLGAAIRKIEPPKKPVFRTRTKLRVNVKIAPTHAAFRFVRCLPIQSR